MIRNSLKSRYFIIKKSKINKILQSPCEQYPFKAQGKVNRAERHQKKNLKSRKRLQSLSSIIKKVFMKNLLLCF